MTSSHPASAAVRETFDWTGVATGWRAQGRQRLWRAHSDRVNLDLVRRWWPNRAVDAVLKTDLFDEAVSDGLLATLSAMAARVAAIDLSYMTTALARGQAGAGHIVTADVRHLPFPASTFDVIVSTSTLDHFEQIADLGAALRELYRTLRPGGRLILTLDNPANPVIAIRNAIPFRTLRALGLVPYFVGATCDATSGRRLLSDSGFDIVNVSAILHGPRLPLVALASICDRVPIAALRRLFLRFAAGWERLARWPTAHRTGYFTAFVAEKRL